MDLSLIASVDFFWKGMVIGFAIAAPVGPIGVLCIRRTLAGGQLAGLLSGLGAATRSEERRVGKECRSRWSPYH